MFRKILIANRGEIACRVMRTAHRLGIATVAVHSDADAQALHVEMADEAVRIGPPPVAESYLRGARIIEAALTTGAEAIHPGYGFLSENPDFVDAVEKSGLTFIGPSSRAIRAMGLKDAAKALMEEAGVPVVPGYHGDDQDDDALAREADAIGYPVLIKAVAGGGGKGMRLVETAAGFPAALASARGEARTAFGNGAVLVEKFVASPRHIEMQVFGDSHGNVVHLFERDCSLQRRHQKVIEEAPAPGMTDDLRAAMGAAAVRAARAIGYSGAGTVEFIVDGSEGLRPDGFWFMEMNTRLQVEHPVTEAITGEDLVEWQLRVACGQELPKLQDELRITGHAVEARLYAEDATKGFLPSTGTLTHLTFPAGIRTDSGVRSGDAISPFYDPMIAKLIAHGATRATALDRLSRALAATRVAGCQTNISFLSRLVRHPSFVAGEVDTGLIARHRPAVTACPEPPVPVVALAALAGHGFLPSSHPCDGFHLWSPLIQTVRLDRDGEAKHADIAVLGPGRYAVDTGAGAREIIVRSFRNDEAVLEMDGKRHRFGVLPASGRITVADGAEHFTFHILDPLERTAERGGAGGDAITAPMPGMVKSVRACAGAEVSSGDPLLVLEAMKMEHTLTAPRDGTIAEVTVEEGTQVEEGVLLLRLGKDHD
ncbi:MAG: acetyl/propionyl/methylcrotonyl-CoA carboxylase subunit alpha [Paracoccaceae bacterium]